MLAALALAAYSKLGSSSASEPPPRTELAALEEQREPEAHPDYVNEIKPLPPAEKTDAPAKQGKRSAPSARLRRLKEAASHLPESRAFLHGMPSRGAREAVEAMHDLCFGSGLKDLSKRKRAVMDEAVAYLVREAAERPTKALTGLLEEAYFIL